MRHALFVILSCFIAAPIAEAQDDWTPPKYAATASPNRVQIIEDNKVGEIRFVIDGKEVARLTADGLHVEGLVDSENSIVLPAEAIPDWDANKTGGGAP